MRTKSPDRQAPRSPYGPPARENEADESRAADRAQPHEDTDVEGKRLWRAHQVDEPEAARHLIPEELDRDDDEQRSIDQAGGRRNGGLDHGHSIRATQQRIHRRFDPCTRENVNRRTPMDAGLRGSPSLVGRWIANPVRSAPGGSNPPPRAGVPDASANLRRDPSGR